MKIRENLVFDKYSYYLLGFVNLGDVTNALDDFKYQCKRSYNSSLGKKLWRQ